jgi:hypothetical protein
MAVSGGGPSFNNEETDCRRTGGGGSGASAERLIRLPISMNYALRTDHYLLGVVGV